MDTKIIGNKIVRVRKKKNISQAQLAEILFISPQAVGKWERGESMPDLITLGRLAEVFGVDLNYFSEKFESVAGEIVSNSLLVNRSADLLPIVSKQNLNWDMSHGKWMDADFSGLKNLHEKFNSSHMQRCKFIRSEMSKLSLKSMYVKNCDFSDADLTTAKSTHLTYMAIYLETICCRKPNF